jgi:hypothetical protein
MYQRAFHNTLVMVNAGVPNAPSPISEHLEPDPGLGPAIDLPSLPPPADGAR